MRRRAAVLALCLAGAAFAQWPRLWKLATAPLKVLTNGPQNDRDWSEDVAVLAEATFDGDRVRVRDVRNFAYRSTTDWTKARYDAEYDLRRLQGVSFVVEPFPGPGAAHTFLTFAFDDGRALAVSVEIRKVKGDRFSPWRGLFNNFELAYVVADERDVIGLRANHRRSDVYLYPIRAPKEKVRELLIDMLRRANALREAPEFYNTLTNTCTTNIWRHVNRIAPKTLPLSLAVLLPRRSDRFAYERGLIDTELPFERARERFKINERARLWADKPEFSRKIRE